MKRALTLLPISLSIGALVLAGCSSDSDDSVTLENSWARTSAAGQTTGAVYFDLTVADDDTLVGASVSSEIAGDAQVHEVVMAEMDADDMDSSEMGDMEDGEMGDMEDGEMGDMEDGEMGDMDGMEMGAMVMQELPDGLVLVAGETVTFEPGGYHIMLLDIAEPFVVGDEIELTLEFAEAGDYETTVVVAESAP